MSLADPTHLLWIDLETTGLGSPHNGEILEIAMIVTEPLTPYKEIDRLQAAIRPMDLWLDTGLPGPESLVDFLQLHPVVAKMHLSNGLLAECWASELYVDDVQRWILAYLTDELGIEKGNARLAGSGIGPFDIPWLRVHMPLLMGFVQYRPMDISSVRSWLQSCGACLEKAESGHRSMQDAELARAEALRLARTWVL